jgi:lysophospholipase L1-like esterase
MVVLHIGSNDLLDLCGNRPKTVEEMQCLYDRVHLNKKGYARWAQVLRPRLLGHWDKHCAEGPVPIYT